jgi:Domain of unknown function (DUF5664)
MLPTTDKERKALPIFTFLTKYFPDAIVAMVNVSVQGNIQHNPELAPADIKWARGKSTDQLNTAMRHMWDHGTGTTRDSDGQYHLAKAAWRILAQLQLTIEDERFEGDVPDEPCREPGIPDEVLRNLTALEAGAAAVATAASVAFAPYGMPPAPPKDFKVLPCCQHGRLICAVCKFPA